VLALLVLIGAGFPDPPARTNPHAFSRFFRLDGFTVFFKILSLTAAALTILFSLATIRFRKNEGGYYSLLLFMTFGLVLMAASTILLMIFMSLEFVSILSYLLVGFLKEKSRKPNEAAIKYFLFGVCLGLMLYAMSLLFGFFRIAGIRRCLQKTLGGSFCRWL